MTRYLMRRRPIDAPFQIFMDHAPGSTFDADLDPEIHDYLVGGGVLEIVSTPKAKSEPTPGPESKPKEPEPKVEPKTEPEPKIEAKSEPESKREAKGPKPDPKTTRQPGRT